MKDEGGRVRRIAEVLTPEDFHLLLAALALLANSHEDPVMQGRLRDIASKLEGGELFDQLLAQWRAVSR